MSDKHDLPAHPVLLMASVMMATVLFALDTTIANVVLPHMQGSLQASQDQVAWVLTSYIVVSALVTPLISKLVDAFGISRVLMVSVGGFTLASLLCGTATSLTQMVFYRMLQGGFGASLIPLSQAVLLNSFPREKHGSALTIWAVGTMIGPILGPTLGGFITDAYNWRWVFFINLPVGLLTLVGIAVSVGRDKPAAARPFDKLGYALLAISLGAFQLMLDRGNVKGWFDSGEIILECAVVGIALYMFVVHSMTTEHPFFMPSLFSDRNFLLGTMLSCVMLTSAYATMALMPMYLQNIQGYSVQEAGLLLSPRGIGMALSSSLATRLAARSDPRLVAVIGLACSAYSFWMISNFATFVPAHLVVWTGFLQGLGLGLVTIPLMTVTYSTLQSSARVEATVVYSILRNVGSSVGITIGVTVLVRATQANQSRLVEHLGVLDTNKWLFLRSVLGEHAEPVYAVEVARQAAHLAYVQDFRLMLLITLIAVPLVVLMRPARVIIPVEPMVEH